MLSMLKVIKNLYKYPSRSTFLFCFALVLGANLFERLGGMYACPLCVLQRWFFLLVGCLALIHCFFESNKIIDRMLRLGILCFAFIGAIFAGRHIYFFSLSYEELSSLGAGCGPSLSSSIELNGFFETIKAIWAGCTSCVQENWRFIFNFAEWSLLGFIFIIMLHGLIIVKKRNQR